MFDLSTSSNLHGLQAAKLYVFQHNKAINGDRSYYVSLHINKMCHWAIVFAVSTVQVRSPPVWLQHFKARSLQNCMAL
jgi:hypothetical protein